MSRVESVVPSLIDPPGPSRINDPRHWRGRAEEARGLAELTNDSSAREKMMGVAASYEKLATRAEERLRPI